MGVGKKKTFADAFSVSGISKPNDSHATLRCGAITDHHEEYLYCLIKFVACNSIKVWLVRLFFKRKYFPSEFHQSAASSLCGLLNGSFACFVNLFCCFIVSVHLQFFFFWLVRQKCRKNKANNTTKQPDTCQTIPLKSLRQNVLSFYSHRVLVSGVGDLVESEKNSDVSSFEFSHSLSFRAPIFLQLVQLDR